MKELEYEIEKLDGAIDSIPIEKILDRMGFPVNYKEIIMLLGIVIIMCMFSTKYRKKVKSKVKREIKKRLK